jgi:hypothetical protein
MMFVYALIRKEKEERKRDELYRGMGREFERHNLFIAVKTFVCVS